MFARELSTPGQTVEAARRSPARISRRAATTRRCTRRTTASRCFTSTAAGAPIRQQDGRFVVGDQQFPARGARRSRRRERPDGFSPNVLLRPIVQDTIFPTICYVAGPNELAYLGQLRGVYEHFGVPMPLIYPRASATLLDSAAMRFLTKYKLPLEALQAQDEAALNELLKTQIPPAVEESSPTRRRRSRRRWRA